MHGNRASIRVAAAATSATFVLVGCATPRQEPEVAFIGKYVGESGPATLTLQILKELPTTPASGWLVSAPASEAVARFRAVRRGTPKFVLEPVFVNFSSEPQEWHSAGRYEWRDGTLTVCMVFATLRGAPGSGKLDPVFDYDTCAEMKAIAR